MEESCSHMINMSLWFSGFGAGLYQLEVTGSVSAASIIFFLLD